MKKIILAMNMPNTTMENIHKFEDKVIEFLERDSDFEKIQVYKYDNKDSLRRATPKILPDIIVLNSELNGYGAIDETIEYLREESNAQIVLMLNRKINEDKDFIEKLIKNKIYDFIEAPWSPEVIANKILRPTPFEMVEQYLKDNKEDIIEDNVKSIDTEVKNIKSPIITEYKRVLNDTPNDIDNNYNIKKIDTAVKSKQNIEFIEDTKKTVIPNKEESKEDNMVFEGYHLEKENTVKLNNEKQKETKKAKKPFNNIENKKNQEKNVFVKQVSNKEKTVNDTKFEKDRILQIHLLPLTSEQSLKNVFQAYKQGYSIIDGNKNVGLLDFYKDNMKDFECDSIEYSKSSIKALIQSSIDSKVFVDIFTSNGIEQIIDKFEEIIIVTPKDKYVLNKNKELISFIKEKGYKIKYCNN